MYHACHGTLYDVPSIASYSGMDLLRWVTISGILLLVAVGKRIVL